MGPRLGYFIIYVLGDRAWKLLKLLSDSDISQGREPPAPSYSCPSFPIPSHQAYHPDWHEVTLHKCSLNWWTMNEGSCGPQVSGLLVLTLGISLSNLSLHLDWVTSWNNELAFYYLGTPSSEFWAVTLLPGILEFGGQSLLAQPLISGPSRRSGPPADCQHSTYRSPLCLDPVWCPCWPWNPPWSGSQPIKTPGLPDSWFSRTTLGTKEENIFCLISITTFVYNPLSPRKTLWCSLAVWTWTSFVIYEVGGGGESSR